MIKEIKIENFKSIQSLNLELGRLNVFIGANGSGKSNILEGITFGAAVLSTKLTNEFLSTRGIRVTEPELMQSGFNLQNSDISVRLFFSNDKKQTIYYTIDWKYGEWTMIPILNKELNTVFYSNKSIFADSEDYYYNKKNITKREKMLPNELEKYEQTVKEDDNKKKEEDNNFQKELSNFLIFAPEYAFLRNQSENQIKPLGIKGEGAIQHLANIGFKKPGIFEEIKNILRLIDWFDDIEFDMTTDGYFTGRIKIKDIYLADGIKYFDLRSTNEGFLYLLFYLTLFISEETPKFFAIDNIDNGMNPKLGSELIHILSKLAKKYDKQVILTTHNPAILDGLDLDNEELDQRLFVISRNRAGHTQAIRVPHRESDERLSYRFIRGAIGGLPKNF